MKPYSLQQMPLDERPRERLVRDGADALSSAELLAIILGSGTKSKHVLQLAEELLVAFGSLENLSQATLSELSEIKGIGLIKAIQLQAAFRLGIRASKQAATPRCKIIHPKQAYDLLRYELENEMREHFISVLLDAKSYLIAYEIISIGTLSQTLVHPREVFYPAIRHKAASFLVVHNHPSGDLTPSKEDLHLTDLLIDASVLLGIPLRDHLIISKHGYVSFREQGLSFKTANNSLA